MRNTSGAPPAGPDFEPSAPFEHELTGEDLVNDQYRTGVNLEARMALHERFSTSSVGLHPWLFAQMDLPPRASILELGGGTGAFCQRNREHISPGWRVTLTDASPCMVLEAAQHLDRLQHSFTFATASAEDLPVPDDSFDAVLARFMLYHVQDRRRALGEIARVLRPRGVFYAATNGTRHMHEAKMLAVRAGLMTPAAVESGDAVGFSLENGAEQLKAQFAHVERRRYEDALVVTETEPLLAYILSSWDVQAVLRRIGPEARQRAVATLRAGIDEALARNGRIHIAKDSGVFIAHRS